MSYHCWTEEEIGSATANDPNLAEKRQKRVCCAMKRVKLMAHRCLTKDEVGSATANDPKSSREKTEASKLGDEESRVDVLPLRDERYDRSSVG